MGKFGSVSFFVLVFFALVFSAFNIVSVLWAEGITYFGTVTHIDGSNYDHYFELYGDELPLRYLELGNYCVDENSNCSVTHGGR